VISQLSGMSVVLGGWKQSGGASLSMEPFESSSFSLNQVISFSFDTSFHFFFLLLLFSG
jgi:hypothetical protein